MADEKIVPENGLEVRYERYKGIIKNFTDVYKRQGICRHAHGLYARLDFAGTAYCCFCQWSCRRPDRTEDFQKAL